MKNPDIESRVAGIVEPLRDKAQKRLLFVCLGNICRSPAAEGVMRSIVESETSVEVPQMEWGEPAVPSEGDAPWIIDSAGTGRYHIGDLPDRRMRLHARDRGYILTHHARQVTEADFARYDLIIGMDSSNLDKLRRLAPSPDDEGKVVAMADFFSRGNRYDHVPDPYYEGSEGFELVLDLLEEGCRNLFDALN